MLFGKLPNGMRYAIMKQANPKGAVAMRLCIEAGSLQESDAQQGLAHFLEHMAFRGSRHVPENQVWPGLQRLGMRVGPDLNAQTGFTRTKYQFNLPRNDDKSIDAGLLRMRDIASELTLSQRAMDEERGVILSEERLRATPDYRMFKSNVEQLFPGSIALSRFTIGKTDVIKNAPVSLIRDFYHAYYRPDRATVIVVGDVDPKVMRTKIVDRFSDWKGVGPAGRDPKQPVPGPRSPQSALFVEPGAPSVLSLSWVTPKQPDSIARERTDLIETVGLTILKNRLMQIANGPQHPFAQVQISPINYQLHTAGVGSVNLLIRPQDWRLAATAAVTAVRRVDQFGVTPDEVTQAIGELRGQLQYMLANVQALPSSTLADLLADNVDKGDVFDSPAHALASAEATFKVLTAQEVDTVLRNWMRHHGPLLFLSSPAPVEGGKSALSAALAAAEAAPLTAVKAEAGMAWPYKKFGTPGKVVERKTIADIDTTFVRFANGVRLTVKPTKFAIGQVAVIVRIGDGRHGLHPDRDSPAWAAGNGLLSGGLKALDFNQINRALAGRAYPLDASFEDDGFIMTARTRPEVFMTQLQLFAAYVSVPGWRESAIDQARSKEAEAVSEASASPGGVVQLDLPRLLHDGDRRWSMPTLPEIAALRLQDVKSLVEPQLASAPVEIVVVGSIGVDPAVQAVAATFGALPRRSPSPPPSQAAMTVHFPKATATPVELHHHGRADQGFAVIAWPASDFFDQQTVQDLQVLKSAFSARLFDQLRVHDAATYTPSVILKNSRTFSGYGYLLAGTELPPAKMPLFFKVTRSIAADLRAHPISADELERARRPGVEAVIARRQTNAYWAASLIDAQTDPRRLDIIRGTLPDLKRVTAADVQRTAQIYLTDAKAWKAIVTPAPNGH